jgi:hypothetical protein
MSFVDNAGAGMLLCMLPHWRVVLESACAAAPAGGVVLQGAA